MNGKTISILGCGWLGLPLGEHLARLGYPVKGSTTSVEKYEALRSKGIEPFQLTVTDEQVVADRLAEFLDADVLIVNFPPKRRDDIETYYPAQFERLLPALSASRVRHLLFVSSTSVYPDLNREVVEEETVLPDKASGKALLRAENLLLSQPGFSTTVVRFSGLIGYDRMPGRFLAGKTNVENGDAPINVIHRDDCIAILTQLIGQEVWGEVFNASADVHPTRKEFYTLAATAIGLKAPDFLPQAAYTFKIINSGKLKKRLGYAFKYPNPLDLVTGAGA